MNKLLPEISMYITKSTISDGLMKWAAVNSDTVSDLYGERMSLELYQKMLGYIRDEVPPPEHFKSMVCSKFWCGGMPYLSIAHYPDLEGKAVPGEPLELFIDGNQLKAKGILFNNKLGNAVWKSLKKDENLPIDDERIRISIAFLDLAHKHGDSGEVFHRKSVTSICPECLKGKGEKIYVDGYLVHLALTRVPVNPRTLMEAEDIMAKKSKIQTRKEDALSIVEDSELVEDIDKTNALETKSDILIEMSETEEVAETPVVEEAKTKKATEDVQAEDSEDDMEEEDCKKPTKKSLTVEDVTEIVKSVFTELSAKVETPVITEKADTVAKVEKSALDIATDELYNSVGSAISLQGVTLEQRLETINPALQNLGTAISTLVRESTGVAQPTPASNETGLVLEAVTSLKDIVSSLAQEVALLKEKSQVIPSNNVVRQVPVPRSITPQLIAQSQTPSINPNSIKNIVRRSVSSQLPLE